MLNMLGFACYSAYNVALFCVPAVQHEYVHAYSKNIPVGLEDVAFSVHAALITAATLAQCVFYDRGGQPLFSWVGRTAAGVGAAALAGCAVVGWAEASGTPGRLSWLNLLLLLSAIKLVVTLTKYIPQVRSVPVCTSLEFLLVCQTSDINTSSWKPLCACPPAHHEGAMRNGFRPRPQGMHMKKARRPCAAPCSGTPSHLRTRDASMCTVQVVMNIRRRSTVGWSIHNVLLDFTGGTTSLVQLLLQCAVQSDWSQIAGNPVKFGLGFISLFFDVTFMIQHYVIYREPQEAAAAPSAVEAASRGASPDEGQGLLPEEEGEGRRQEPLDEV